MTIRHVWSVLCSKSTVDRETNNVSLIEVLEQLEITATVTRIGSSGQAAPPIPTIPGAPFTGELVTLWARTDPAQPARGIARVRLLSPQGAELAAFEYAIDVSTNARLRNQGRVQGLRLAGDGWYD